MPNLTDKKSARALRFKEASEDFLDALTDLEAARADMVADGLTLVDADFTGVTAHISAADLTSLQSTIDALRGLLVGHLTNITKVAGR